MKELSTKLAKFEVYEHAVSNMLEVKRQMETVIHELEDDKTHNAKVIQLLRHQVIHGSKERRPICMCQ